MTIGDRIRILRRAKRPRMSQADLGLKVGVSAQQIHKYETGNDRIMTDRLIQIALALNVSASALLDDPPPAAAPPPAVPSSPLKKRPDR